MQVDRDRYKENHRLRGANTFAPLFATCRRDVAIADYDTAVVILRWLILFVSYLCRYEFVFCLLPQHPALSYLNVAIRFLHKTRRYVGNTQ